MTASGKQKHYLIIPRLGDPLYEEGRARLIWSANTAEATQRLGFPAALSDSVQRSLNPLCLKRDPVWTRPPESFRRFYNVGEAVRVFHPHLFMQGPRSLDAVSPLSRYGARRQLARQLLSAAACLHTRDWKLVELAVDMGIPTIFEDHAESFHTKIQSYPQSVAESHFFLRAVAISNEAEERMRERGMPDYKILHLPSGLNQRSFERFPETARRVRENYLVQGYRRLVIYSGGLYPFRGVDMLMAAAKDFPETFFLFCGGRERQVRTYENRAEAAGLENVEFSGYLPHGDLLAFLQAADLLVLPYEDPEIARITSPLKFYEYLAAGVPIVSARMPMLAEFVDRDDLAVVWSDIGDRAGLGDSLQKAFDQYPRREQGYAANRELARNYTWDERQRKLFRNLEGHPLWPPDFGGGEMVPEPPRPHPARSRAENLCFVISEYNRGWVLETICRRIEAHYPEPCKWAWTRKNRSFTGEMPDARRYWFSHFQLLLTCLKQFPWIRERELYVWFTHPSKEEIPLSELVDALNQCHRVIFACSLHRDEMIRYGLRPEVAEVVLGGAEPARFRAHTRGEGKIGFCSAFYPRKSPEVIMGLVRAMPQRQFILVGPQSEGMKTTERLWPNYEYFDELCALPNLEYVEAPYADYPDYYAQMDTFVMPSRLEGGPIPLLEAMMCNAVPVSSRTGFAPDLIRHGENGFLFDVDEPLEHLVSLVERAQDLTTDIRASVLPYSWEGFTQRILSMQRERESEPAAVAAGYR